MRSNGCFCILVCLVHSVYAYDWGTNAGDGSAGNPYQIAEANQLVSIGSDAGLLDKHFVLTADIDLSAYTGTKYNIIGGTSPFRGVFDGRGYRIRHLTYRGDNAAGVGLFGRLDHARLSNVYLEDVHIQTPSNAGGLAGFAGHSVVVNCHSEGSVSGVSMAGGLIGDAAETDVFDCTTSGVVAATGRLIGGLLGQARGIVQGCSSDADVSGDMVVGGLVGGYYGAMSDCTTNGTVAGSWGTVGGLVGSSWGVIRNCHSTAPVSGGDSVGGLAGGAGGAGDFMIRCSASGTVTGTKINSFAVGGLVGRFTSGTIRQCFAAGDVICEGAASSRVGGFAGAAGGGNYPPAFYDCYAAGDVYGHEQVGGFAGQMSTTTLKPCEMVHCYSRGLVQGDSKTGGLLGVNGRADSVFGGLFWDATASQTLDGIGSQDPDPDEVTGMETPGMKERARFVGWDFVGEVADGENGIWRMCADGVDYPRLGWETARNGDFACGDGVDVLDLQALAAQWLTVEATGPAAFDYACDADGDGAVDMVDFSAAAKNWRR